MQTFQKAFSLEGQCAILPGDGAVTLYLGSARRRCGLVVAWGVGCVPASAEMMLRNPLVSPGTPGSHLSSEDLGFGEATGPRAAMPDPSSVSFLLSKFKRTQVYKVSTVGQTVHTLRGGGRGGLVTSGGRIYRQNQL